MNKYLKYLITFIIVISIGVGGYFYFTKSNSHSEHAQKETIYTCPMHPQIIRDQPGNCPICGMTLVEKVAANNKEENTSIENLLRPTDKFIVGTFLTTTAIDTSITTEINLPGFIEYDPNSSVNIAAWVSGRIEKMYVHYKFQSVTKGQKLFDLYSPELLTEQQNYIYLISNDPENTSIIKASKQKLVLYGMTQNQISSLTSSKKVNPQISIYSPASGIIDGTETIAMANKTPMQSANNNTEILNVKEGNYIKKGEVIFKLVNTNKVWGVFNVIQGYNSLIKTNQSIKIKTELDENKTIDAKIDFIETQLNPKDKTNRIRVYLNNKELKLPIGLQLQGIVKTNPTKGLWLQKQAFISVGNKKIVFLKQDNGFKVTAITTGIEIDNYVQIIEGLSAKDTIAENAQYLIDSESFIKTE